LTTADSVPAERQRELLRKVRRLRIQTAHLIRDLLGGQYRSAFKGRGMAFSEVREYTPGDDIRSIDWNVTARMNAPFIKLFVEERELTLMLMVDVSRSLRFGSGRRSKLDLAVELAAILGFSAIQNNDRAGLILFSDRVEKYVPPNKGDAHALRILRDLLFFPPAGRATAFRPAFDFLNSVRTRRSVVFVISDFMATDLADALPITARRHDLIAARIVDPIEDSWPRIGLLELEDLETGRTTLVDTSSGRTRAAMESAAAESRNRIRKLFRSCKLDDITFRTDQSVVDPLRRFFYARRRRRM